VFNRWDIDEQKISGSSVAVSHVIKSDIYQVEGQSRTTEILKKQMSDPDE